MNKDAALAVTATFGIGRFRVLAKATANVIGIVLSANIFKPLRTYSNGSDFIQKRMCDNNLILCY